MTPASECPGTSLANVDPVGDPRPADVWRGQRNRFLIEDARATGQRMHLLGGAIQLAIYLVFLDAGYPAWRVITAGTVFVSFALIQGAWFRSAHDSQTFDRVFIGINLSAQTMVTVIVGLTGGLLPQDVVGPLLPPTHYAIALSIGLGWNLFLLHTMVAKMTRAASKAGQSMACLREERLSDAEAQLRRLQSVGAKVAHELKNPLASIKGLCQLVSRTPESERTQERLAVVASEIGRMETILNAVSYTHLRAHET